MEDEEIFFGNDEPNLDLKEVCDDLFFGTTELAGNVGLKNLAYIVSASTQEFEAYLDAQIAPVMQDDGMSQ